MSEEKKPQGINIELSEEIAEGIYSNLAIITHSSSEFIVDYIRIMPGVPKGKVKSRVVMTPEHAKKLHRALSDNLSKYEKSHGKIKESDQISTIPLNFGGPTIQRKRHRQMRPFSQVSQGQGGQSRCGSGQRRGARDRQGADPG